MTTATPSPADYPPIPYGRAAFPSVRRDGCLYVDKTRFIRDLERERYVFLVRPRRFGKSFWLATLASYYDRRHAGEFEGLFGDTDIAEAPTPNRHRHVVLYFDFSAFDGALPTLEASFQTYCGTRVAQTLESHSDLFSAADIQRVLAPERIDGKLNELFGLVGARGVPLYVLIDEYDNFANTILAADGEAAYRAFVSGGGFYRSFYATLKAGTALDGSLDRLFVTGVSPITMDDLTSGFNIARNISLLPQFNEMLGFTAKEVECVLNDYRNRGVFDQDVSTTLDLMHDWYDGYRFATGAANAVFNPDMVLNYLDLSLPNKPGPEDLIDPNVRIDYAKLRHLLLTGRRLNGNFDLLRETMAEERAEARVVPSFPLAELAQRENFLSLLHYFGLLSIAGPGWLRIPNQTVRQLMYGYLRGAYRDVGVFAPDFVELDRLTRRMASEGKWQPAIERLRDAIAEHTGVRDYLHGEKILQGFLAAYLSVAGYFAVHAEVELAKGYSDLMLTPLPSQHPGMNHGFLVELKYVSRAESAQQRVPTLAAQAEAQLRRYLADPWLARQYADVQFTGIVLVFRGWELVHSAAVRA